MKFIKVYESFDDEKFIELSRSEWSIFTPVKKLYLNVIN